MIRRGAVIGAVLAVLVALPGIVREATAVEYPCAPGSVQIEDQQWWIERTGEAWPGRHVHQQLCWPTAPVTGTVSLPMRVLLHAQPPGAKLTRLRITDGSGATLWSKTSGLGLPVNGEQTLNVTVSFSVTGLSSGFHEMRLASIVSQPSGAQQFVSSGHPLYVRTAAPPGTSRDRHEARGWYTGFEYTNARLNPKSGQNANQALDALRTVTPGETFLAECAAPSGRPITHCSVWLDPNAHAGNPGTLLGTISTGPAKKTITLPALSSGLHKVMVRAESKGSFGGQSGTNAGIFVITVLVP